MSTPIRLCNGNVPYILDAGDRSNVLHYTVGYLVQSQRYYIQRIQYLQSIAKGLSRVM